MPDPTFADAVARAARLLATSRAPVIAGLGADIAGIVAAFRLAEKLGAAVDHAAAGSALRDQAVLQDIGLMLTSLAEVRRRADTLLIVGDRPMEAQPDLASFLLAQRPADAVTGAGARQIVTVASRAPGPVHAADAGVWLKADLPDLPGVLAALRACVNRRPLAQGFDAGEVKRCAEVVRTARFGVAIWSPDEIDALAVEMLAGLIRDANAKTRWSGLSVSADPSVAGAAMASGWMTGLPLRCGFGRGRPEHDPWAYDASRLVESGEADAVVWVSAFGDPLPDWVGAVPAVVIADPSALADTTAAVALPAGRPGVDHDGVLYDARTGTLVEVEAERPSNLASVAETLTRIAAGLDPP